MSDLDAISASEICNDRVRERDLTIERLKMLLAECVARLGLRVDFSDCEFLNELEMSDDWNIATSRPKRWPPNRFPLVKHATGTPSDHDEPCGDWPPIVPGTFPIHIEGQQ